MPCAPIFGIAVAEHARALGLQPVARGDDIVDFIADMMDAAVRVLLKKLGDRRAGAQRLEQLDLGVRQLDENDRDAVFGLGSGGRTLAPSDS